MKNHGTPVIPRELLTGCRFRLAWAKLDHKSRSAISPNTQNEPLSQHPARSRRTARCVDYPWGERPGTYHDRAIPTTWHNDNTASGRPVTADGVSCWTGVSRRRGWVVGSGTAGQHCLRVHAPPTPGKPQKADDSS
jgi:hypothetical protein